MSTLELLGSAPQRRIGVHVSPAALGQIRRGSPWVFGDSVQRISGADAPSSGDLAVVFDGRRRFAAIGLWDSDSEIRIRILHRDRPIPIDDVWWQTHLATALERRANLLVDSETSACRLIHGENDSLPGLVVDRYASTLVVKVYSTAWFAWLGVVVPNLRDALGRYGVAVDAVVLRAARRVRLPDDLIAVARCETGRDDALMLVGEVPRQPVRYRERGVRLTADVIAGNKTGAFLDQRDNRGLVRSMAAGTRMLDVFANTGGFAVSAALGGATAVHLVDQSAPALMTARDNLALNRITRCDVRTTTGDAFEVLEALARSGEQYDLVVIDPPSFARSAAQIPAAERAYRKLTIAGLGVLERGGTLVQASCSNRIGSAAFCELVLDAAQQYATSHRLGEAVELRRTGHPVDHPIGFEYGEYLKAVFVQLR